MFSSDFSVEERQKSPEYVKLCVKNVCVLSVNLGVLVFAVPVRVEMADASAEGGGDGVTRLSVTLTDPIIHCIHFLHKVLIHLKQKTSGVGHWSICVLL